MYVADFGSTMVWNESGEILAYLAEKKFPKPRPFFSSDVPDEMSNDLSGKDTKGPRVWIILQISKSYISTL